MRCFSPRGCASYAVTVLLTSMLIIGNAGFVRAADPENSQICDATADYFLGNDDYPEAVRLHRLIVEQRPNDALAHYHLGYAEGMMGQTRNELEQYQTAALLGLKDWDLYLNLGRVYLEQGRIGPATQAFQTAVALGPDHPEGHFNLGLAYERQGMLDAASVELNKSLTLDPSQSDARNMLALVDAEQGNYLGAQKIWTELTRSEPNFAPAQANLAILESALKRRAPAEGALAVPSFQSASALSPQ
ncbi:MAG TPA: tetratricopeptide repeat protein [Candidatus Binataceae bacterium]|nr:tetratricopeptide repeat protein [Candidatus Binataceae bacterium]